MNERLAIPLLEEVLTLFEPYYSLTEDILWDIKQGLKEKASESAIAFEEKFSRSLSLEEIDIKDALSSDCFK